MPQDIKTDQPSHTVEYLGPYETWVHGDGRPYAYPPIRDNEESYLSALAENSGAGSIVNAESVQPNMEADSKINPIFPPIWWTPGLRFVPFFFRNPNKGYLEQDAETLNLLLNNIDAAQLFSQALIFGDQSLTFDAPGGIPGWKDGTVDVDPRFRVNFPLHESSIHPEFRSSKQGAVTELSTPECKPNEKIGEGKGRIVVVGVIDDGIPFANSSFLDSTSSTRIEFFWAQSGLPQKTKPTVPFGCEFNRNEIDDLIARFPDEDDLYRSAEVTGFDSSENGAPLNRFATHGSIVLDILAGNSAAVGDELPDEVRVVAVQLPNAIGWDTSGFGKDMFMLSAFHYIFERARKIAESYNHTHGTELPLVVNFSYGFTGGAHDGETELEAAIGQLIEARRQLAPTAVTIPSGNTFHDKMHGAIMPPQLVDGEYSFNWVIQPNDQTSSYLELWFPVDDSNVVADHIVELTPPSGGGMDAQLAQQGISVSGNPSRRDGDPRNIKTITDGSGAVIGQISADEHRGRRWRVMIALAPSEPKDANAPRAEAGDWVITVKRAAGKRPLRGPIRCWVQRDSDPARLGSGGRQSYLKDIAGGNDSATQPHDAENDAPGAFVRRYGTLNGIATHRLMTVVGGVDRNSHKPASYSSADAVDDPVKPVSCSAVSERSVFLPGVSGSGTRTGSLSQLSGTSAAAPLAARVLAKQFSLVELSTIESAAELNYVSILPGIKGETLAQELARATNGETEPLIARLGAVVVGIRDLDRTA